MSLWNKIEGAIWHIEKKVIPIPAWDVGLQPLPQILISDKIDIDLERENDCAPGKAPKEGIIFTHAQLDPRVNIIGSNWSPWKLMRQENKNFLQTDEQKGEVVRWIGHFTSQLTIFQSYMWWHIDVQADWRSCSYGRAPNAIGISQGSLTCPSKHRHGTNLFIRWFRHTAPISRL